MEQIPSWEADSRSTYQEIPCHIRPCGHESHSRTYPEPDDSSPHPNTVSLICIFNIILRSTARSLRLYLSFSSCV
jgi:hypothetical protein